MVATDLAESFRRGCRPGSTMPPGWPIPSMRRGSATGAWTRSGAGCRTRRSTTAGSARIDPLCRIRELLLNGGERRLDENGNARMLLGLRAGDPKDEVLGAWLAKESVRDVYLTADAMAAATLLDKAIAGCIADEVPEEQILEFT